MLSLFTALDFNESEIRTYLSLAELGRASGSALAKKSNQPRSTTYSALEGLIKRGLVSTEQDRDTVIYRANQPSALVSMVNSERSEAEQRFKRKEQTAKELVTIIEPYFQQKNFSVPKIQFYEGARNVERMLYENEAAWQESLCNEDLTWWGYQDLEFVKQYREWLDKYWSRMKPGERIWLLSNQSVIENRLAGKVPRRIIKQIPPGIEFSSTIWIVGEYVVMIMIRQKPHYAYVLRDAVFAANQRAIFKLLWGVVK